MPGVLITESLAQAGAIAILSMEENKGKKCFIWWNRQNEIQKNGCSRR